MTALEKLLKKWIFTMACERRKLVTDDEREQYGNAGTLWAVKIHHGMLSYTTLFWQGSAYKVKPKLADVMHCLLSDSAYGELLFEDYCESLGATKDSRQSYKTWELTVATSRAMKKLIGDGEIRQALIDAANEY